MKIAILGASGFIGQKLAQKYLALGNEVRYLTRTDDSSIVGANAFLGDLNSNLGNLNFFLNEVNLLINCAGVISNESLMYSTHVRGTLNILEILETIYDKKNGIFHWVQLSSCGAYGQPASHPSVVRHINEEVSDNPSGEYERTKTEADNLLIAFANKHEWFKYTIIRPTNVFGIGMRSTAIVRIAKMIKLRIFFYVGNKNAIANFVHVDDVVKAILLSTNQPKTHNQTFIISNDCKFTDMIDAIAESLGARKPTFVVNELLLRKCLNILNRLFRLPINTKQIDVMMRQTHYSNKKIKEVIDWAPSKPIVLEFKQYIDDVFNAK